MNQADIHKIIDNGVYGPDKLPISPVKKENMTAIFVWTEMSSRAFLLNIIACQYS